jgi:hypothetical protein
MRTVKTLATLALVLGGVVPASAGTIGMEATLASPVRYLPPPGITSDNVTYVGTIPDTPGIGGRMLKVGNQTRFYVTGAKGLTIYDVTNPALPTVIGALPLPHFQNEDVDVSDDGSRVIISTDTVHAGPNGTTVAAGGGSIRVIDTSNPAMPRVTAYIASGNHTTTCADAKCDWLYGSSGNIYDARTPGVITQLPTGVPGGGGHAFNRDASGLLISDSGTRRVLDVTNPASPVIISDGKPKGTDGLLQHNNVRPRADQWVPRVVPESGVPDPEFPLRPGELLIGNSESNVRPQCNSTAGGLSTWSMADFDKGAKLEQLKVFRPVNGTYTGDGNPAVNALGCSGHWFTERNNVVAASWYEHGVKFFKINPENGEIAQIGYFQPVVTEAGASHWVTDAAGNEYVYNVDYARGIDILKFDRSVPAPSEQELYESWVWNLENLEARGLGAMASAERFACSLAMRRGLTVA